jgi:hypothetical protein
MGELDRVTIGRTNPLVGDTGAQVVDPHAQVAGFRCIGVDPDMAVRDSIAVGVDDDAVLEDPARRIQRGSQRGRRTERDMPSRPVTRPGIEDVDPAEGCILVIEPPSAGRQRP